MNDYWSDLDDDAAEECACCGEEIGVGGSSGGAFCHACNDAGCSVLGEHCLAEED